MDKRKIAAPYREVSSSNSDLQSAELLLVEDNPVDVMITLKASGGLTQRDLLPKGARLSREFFTADTRNDKIVFNRPPPKRFIEAYWLIILDISMDHGAGTGYTYVGTKVIRLA